eukprot:CAMPEP_0184863422 /NCGR_PEP_ID=MMETSP0580-20130426/11024_1 /TAXON_ID=1118495 /ORGANISM="Dactyliosolen fragilissimus" /LENGTH=385 /DNA_ID=CAMNT_0027361741 /DNA_START=3 /DNA_END=1160 /DNA_ORIENTATION=+
MRFFSSVLALLATQNACAFTAPKSTTTITTKTSLALPVVADPSIPQIKNDSIKYETDVDVENKFKVKEVDPAILDPKKRVQTGRYNDKKMSIAVPFLKRPNKLDGTHAGDVGFDPLGLSESNDLYTMMEAELRHSRLAMLAVIGWPLSELYAPNWMLHGKMHLAPSVLNGFDPLSFIAVAAIFGGFGYLEYKTSLRRTDDKRIGMKHKEDMANVWKYGVPGDYNFDPLNLYSAFGDTADGRKAMRELEVAHGRSAMLGITAFAAWEALTGHPIVENSMFFHPNALLPTLALAYLGFGFFYEIEDSDQYLFQIKQSSEGAGRIERIKNGLNYMKEDAIEYAAIATEVGGNYAEKFGTVSNDLKQKYDQLTQDYTKKVMSKNYDVSE